jgi:predicted transcriptional regulator
VVKNVLKSTKIIFFCQSGQKRLTKIIKQFRHSGLIFLKKQKLDTKEIKKRKNAGRSAVE